MRNADAALMEIARDVGRLRPDWRNPERYFEERNELEHRLKRLATSLRNGRHHV